MNIAGLGPTQFKQQLNDASATALARGNDLNESTGENDEVRKQFDKFVGESFYGQMLGSMRKTVDKPAYFHGGQAEEIFRGQLDQMLASKLSDATAHSFTGPMFELFSLHRS